MRKLVGVAVLAAVLAVSGCAAGAESPGGISAAEMATQRTAAPITMTPEASEPAQTASPYGDYTQDEFYVKSVKAFWKGTLPSDQELIASGAEACNQLRAGTSQDAVVAVQGDGADAASNNNRVVVSAIQVYCPEFS